MASSSEINQLSLKILLLYQAHFVPAVPAAIYLVSIISGLDKEQSLNAALYLLPTLFIPFAVLLPFLLTRHILRQALTQSSGEAGDARLQRLLRVPRLIELWMTTCSVISSAAYVALPSLYYGKSLWAVPLTAWLVLLLIMLVWIQVRISVERLLRPYALQDFWRSPDMLLQQSSVLWVRQRWYLPYAFVLYVACTASMLLTVLYKASQQVFNTLALESDKLTMAELQPLLKQAMSMVISQVTLPLTLIGLFLVVTATVSAWRLAQYQSEGTLAVQRAIESLASGSPQMPDWVGTDELGDLSLATSKVFVHLKQFSLSIGDSALTLMRSARELAQSTTEQNEVIARQAAALQETQVTAQEIKQTSAMASQKAEAILRQTEQVDAIGQAAESAIERSVRTLQEIRESVKQMAQSIQQLGDKTQQIANITGTVKDLADQSNMLALNAAIEAVRSGEAGKGFGVVAREIRSLADQSILATQNVREILQDITTAVTATVNSTERGVARIEEGVEQVREFGESVRQLSNIVRESGASVRQIYAAVAQQNTGVGEIFKAISELSRAMDQTLERLKASDQALSLVQGVTEQVSSFVKSYGWQDLQPSRPPQATPVTRS